MIDRREQKAGRPLAAPPEPRKPLGYEEIMALPLRPCTDCTRFVGRECQHYGRRLPQPTTPCRCVHFAARPDSGHGKFALRR